MRSVSTSCKPAAASTATPVPAPTPTPIPAAPVVDVAGELPADFQIALYQGENVLGGQEIKFSNVFVQGKPVVLSVWAGRCPICHIEMPDLQKVYTEYNNRVLRERSMGNAFVFGTAYATGSLSCTLPIFLVVVGTSLTGGELLSSFGQSLGYALGMGTIIFGVTIGAVLFRRAMTRWLRLMSPYIHRLGALFLVGAGLYLVYYWVFQAGLS